MTAPGGGAESSAPARVGWFRFALVVAAGVVGGRLVWLCYAQAQPPVSDFDHIHLATRAMLAGRDPYAAVAASGWPSPLFYPATAMTAALPLAPLPLPLARAAFGAIATGGLVLALASQPWRLLALTSGSFVAALVGGQWSPLLLAALLRPRASGLWAIKPNIGLACFAARPTPCALMGGMALLAASLVLDPTWPMGWFRALEHRNVVAPIARPGGAILLLALLRWRRPEARLVVGLALVPLTTVLYETLLLFSVPRRWPEVIALSALSLAALYASRTQCPASPWPS